MIHLSVDDFIFEVKEELACFEEVGRTGAHEWEKNFKLNFSPKDSIALDDESVIFEIADEYIAALEKNRVSDYWKNFKI